MAQARGRQYWLLCNQAWHRQKEDKTGYYVTKRDTATRKAGLAVHTHTHTHTHTTQHNTSPHNTHTHTHTLTTQALSKAGFAQREGGFATRDLHARPVLLVRFARVESIEVDTHAAVGDSHGHSVLVAVLSEFHAERGVPQSFVLRNERSPCIRVVEILDQRNKMQESNGGLV